MKPPAATLAILLLVACTSDPPAPPAPATAPPTTVATGDPYEVYLTLPGADPGLSRDDAQLRALLGACRTWAPGTVDAALAEAYAPLVEQWKREGVVCKDPTTTS